ncbi:CDP-glucose 4,6-dehydratase [Paenibacillus dauci]|uniref:CDP-glucose 4,6-dehydratase n=1 Tax=Paenibacillus dauci TaxID=1567106 RepID=UPI000619A368|nr:CDP-glucose 4,6-dehydratase [Paenibacillus dauci]
MTKNKVNELFWKDKNVFLTGHTGFKGSWLSLWLHKLGANVTGYSLPAPTSPSLFEVARVEEVLTNSIIGDINNYKLLCESMRNANPEIVIHMAAQPLVRRSYNDPIETYQTNVMGTVHIMEAARACSSIQAILNVTTDKCYENKEWEWGYREYEPLGGHDPYSSSKACSELVTAAYRDSFLKTLNINVATARAGNVIGGGDWAEDRLIPDLLKYLINQEQVQIRNPSAIRPWQHVLEPLKGYLLLCENLVLKGKEYAQAWNFGPLDSEMKTVQSIVEHMLEKWPNKTSGYVVTKQDEKTEATILKLDSAKAANNLGWKPYWSLDTTLNSIIQWTLYYEDGKDMREVCREQISQYEN